MNELIEKVEEWARVRRLHTADPKAQALKVVEEFTEMIMAFNDFTATKKGAEDVKNEVIDGVGDTYVTLIILCQQLDIDFVSTLTRRNLVLKGEVAEILNYLSTAVSKGKKHNVEYAVMDISEVANRIASYVGIEPIECLQVAYNEIKDRKGMMIDGTFIKYDDLSDENKETLDNA